MAQFNVAIAYENGTGLDKDLAQAAMWYKKSAEQGTNDAQHNLGYLFLTGDVKLTTFLFFPWTKSLFPISLSF